MSAHEVPPTDEQEEQEEISELGGEVIPLRVPAWNTSAPGVEGFARFLEGILRNPIGPSPTVRVTGDDEVTINGWK